MLALQALARGVVSWPHTWDAPVPGELGVAAAPEAVTGDRAPGVV